MPHKPAQSLLFVALAALLGVGVNFSIKKRGRPAVRTPESAFRWGLGEAVKKKKNI